MLRYSNNSIFLFRIRKTLVLWNGFDSSSLWAWGKFYEFRGLVGKKKQLVIKFFNYIEYKNFLDSVYYLYKISYLWWYMFLNTYGIGYKMRWVRMKSRRSSLYRFFLGHTVRHYVMCPQGMVIKIYEKKTVIFMCKSSSVLYEFMVHIISLKAMEIYKEKGLKRPDIIYTFKPTNKLVFL